MIGCGICDGVLMPCPVCHTWGAPKDPHISWEERLNLRRHKGTSEAPLQQDTAPEPVAFAFTSITTQTSDRVGPKYSRAFNNEYDGPGRGSN